MSGRQLRVADGTEVGPVGEMRPKLTHLVVQAASGGASPILW